MLAQLFWFGLGAAVMRYAMKRQGRSRDAAGANPRSQAGGAPAALEFSSPSVAAGGSTGGAQGLQQSRLGADRQDLQTAVDTGPGSTQGMGNVLPDDGQEPPLMPFSSGTGMQGAQGSGEVPSGAGADKERANQPQREVLRGA